MTDKEFNDVIERLSKIWRKSFAETLRDLCNDAGIEFKLTLSAKDKKEIMRRVLELNESNEILSEEKRSEISKWISTGRKEKNVD